MAEQIDYGGPWSVCDRSEIRSGNLHLVAVVQHGLKQQGYASLIAAAPDMLAALQLIGDGPHDAEAIADMLGQVRAAIAKATGVQHG
jgi:hypothetical protein